MRLLHIRHVRFHLGCVHLHLGQPRPELHQLVHFFSGIAVHTVGRPPLRLPVRYLHLYRAGWGEAQLPGSCLPPFSRYLGKWREGVGCYDGGGGGVCEPMLSSSEGGWCWGR